MSRSRSVGQLVLRGEQRADLGGSLTYDQMVTPEGLAEIATYADGPGFRVPGEFVVMGDCNMLPGSAAYLRMTGEPDYYYGQVILETHGPSRRRPTEGYNLAPTISCRPYRCP